MIQKIKRLKDHSGFMKYFKNTSWLFAEKILRMVVGLFVGVWVARYLGPDKYGLLSYAQSFVGLFAAIATLGLDGIVVRELVKHERHNDDLIGTAFWLKVMGAFGVLLFLGIAVQFTSNDHYTNMLIFIIASATIFQSFNVVDMYFQAKVMSKYAVYVNIISLFISSIVKIILILKEAPLIAFAWVVLFDSFVLACGYVYFYFIQVDAKDHLHSVILKWKLKREVAVDLLKDSWPLMLSGIVIGLYMKIDQVMIKEMLDSEAVGQYAAAVRLSEAWYFIPMVITTSLFPAIINAKKISEELYLKRLQKLYDLMVWMAIAIALPMTFMSDWVVDLLYGKAYSDTGDVLIIYIWGGIFIFLEVAQDKFWIMNNLQKQQLIIILSCISVNIILNLFFINRFGIYGAAFTTVISHALGSLVFPLLFKEAYVMISHTYKSFLLWRYMR